MRIGTIDSSVNC